MTGDLVKVHIFSLNVPAVFPPPHRKKIIFSNSYAKHLQENVEDLSAFSSFILG